MSIKYFNAMYLIFIITFFFINTTFTVSDELIVEIDNPKFSEKGLNDKVYEIKAEKGFKSESALELLTVEGKFKTGKKGRWIYLEADKGNFSQETNHIELENNIIFYTDDGEKIKSDRASFDMNNDVIKLNEKVSHESIKGLILSDSSIITNNFNKIIYLGNVKSLIKN